MGGGGAWTRGGNRPDQPHSHLRTGGKGPADLGGAQWVGLGSGREGSSAREASGRGGRDHTKGGAAAVLPGVGGPSPPLPYLQSTAPHALRRALRLTGIFVFEAGHFPWTFAEASRGARPSLWDADR